MTKTTEQYFVDWELNVFGFGYGTGEPYTLAALKKFMDNIGTHEYKNSYNHEKLEDALTPTVAWLLINTLCSHDIIEYGTSPRYGWLTKKGEALKEFIDAKSIDDLVDMVCASDAHDTVCMPDACNCASNGDQLESRCKNPFW